MKRDMEIMIVSSRFGMICKRIPASLTMLIEYSLATEAAVTYEMSVNTRLHGVISEKSAV
jgi:hypothetical protein